MFALPGLVLLVVLDFLKPQEYVPLLAGLPLLHLCTALTLVGFVVDLRLGLSRLVAAPQLGLACAFFAWSVLTDLPYGPGFTARAAFTLFIPFSLFLLVGHVVQSLRGLRVLVLTMLALGLFLGVVGVHQRLAPMECYRVAYAGADSDGIQDGRPCSPEDAAACWREGAEPGVDYVCEHVGLLGSRSIQGRVRFRGAIRDPNELALAVAAIMPLAFAFRAGGRKVLRFALGAGALVLAGACVVFTGSRGGQIVFGAVLLVYLVRRMGKRGLLVAGLAALPILVLGGRDRGDAAASTLERLECWSRGMQLFRRSPVLGVGLYRFTEHHYLTAHNSYVLTAAELGLVGMVLWTSLVYVSVKVPLLALLHRLPDGEAPPEPVRSWALSLLACMAGLVAGVFFLSYAYKEALWISLGLTAALHHAVRRHDPAFRVTFDRKDLLRVVLICLGLIVAITAYTRLKLGF